MSPALKTLTVLESERLLDVILADSGTQKKKMNGLRNYTIALLLLDAGLRVGEAVHLLQTDLVVAWGPVESLCIPAEIAKNKTSRIVPLTQRLRAAIAKMIRYWWNDISPTASPHAFFQAGKIPPVTTRQVERIIRAASMVSLGRPIHPHILRHTFASRLMRTVNARIVQELLGHKNMSSTQIYTHPNHEDLKKAIATTEQTEAMKKTDNYLL
jgi:integrase/recombinase XerC